MTKICITQFFGYSVEGFYQYLRLYRPSFIEVIIPKEYDDQVPDLLADDYFRAMYAGQLLHRIAEDFMFTHPHPGIEGEFSFIIITTQLKKLAKILFLLSQAYDWEGNDRHCLAFAETAADIEGYLGEDEELVCEAFLAIIEDYLEDGF